MRLPNISPDDYSPLQQQLVDSISAKRGAVRGPFQCMLHSPELLELIEPLANYLRFESAIPLKLREFSLLIAARFWDAQDSWNAHVGKALEAGLSDAVVQALAEKRAPDFQEEDEALFYRFCKELLENHFVSDETYAAAQAAFGDRGLVDTIACIGTFSMFANLLNGFQLLAPNKPPPFADISGFARIGERTPLG